MFFLLLDKIQADSQRILDFLFETFIVLVIGVDLEVVCFGALPDISQLDQLVAIVLSETAFATAESATLNLTVFLDAKGIKLEPIVTI